MMSKLIYSLKREINKWWGFFVVFSSSVLVANGYFLPNKNTSIISMLFISVLFISVLWNLFSKQETLIKGKILRYLKNLEKSLLYVVGVAVFIQYTSGSSSVFYPLNYAVFLIIGAFFSLRILIPVLLIGSGLEYMGIVFSSVGTMNDFYFHTGFNVLFALSGYLTFRLEILKLKKTNDKIIEKKINSLKKDADDFRLIGTTVSKSSRAKEDMDKLMIASSIENIRSGVYQTLCILRESMNLTSVVLLWIDNSGQELNIKEISSISEAEFNSSFHIKQGLIGSIVRNRLPLSIGDFRYNLNAIPYYKSPQEIHSFLGVPILENGQLRGVLCTDRLEISSFSNSEIEIFKKAAEQIIKMVITERIVNQMEQSKFEQEKFFNASSLMNQALSIEDVIESSFISVGSIINFTTAILIKREEENICKILGFKGNVEISEENMIFSCEKSLLYMVFANRHYLPVNGELRDPSQNILGNGIQFDTMNSLLIMPLIVGDKVIGAFLLGSENKGVFTSERRDMLGVISNQIAISLQNSFMYEKLEQMATTDGLTKLTNRRTFQEKYKEMFERAKRNKTPLSIFITDIDKFKSVNDTYGHLIGDIVIKKVSAILKEQARNIDLVARYGGEEFVVVLESTDSEGAKILAERIRQEVEKQVFDSPIGQFKTSISLGIATFPHDSLEKENLLKKSDDSLYWAKEHGRNQVVYFGDIKNLI